jgi:hypothetical protein
MALRNWSEWLRFGVPGLVLGLGLAWSLDGRGPVVHAEPPNTLPMPANDRGKTVVPPQAGADGSGTIAFSASYGSNAQLLTVIDTKTRAFAVYRIDPSNPKGSVKLEAVRQYQWDLQLTDYNNLQPEVAAIKSTVKSLGQTNR